MKGNAVAIVPAAGAGKRFGEGTRKAFEVLAGKPVLIRTLEALDAVAEIQEIIPVIKEEEMEYVVGLFEQYAVPKVRRVAPGGRERHDSVLHGLHLVEAREGLVLVHDGVRPLVEPHLISYALTQFKDCDGVVLGVPVKDTIKEVKEGEVHQTLDRQYLWAIQTPQIFRYDTLSSAYEKAAGEAFSSTDDAALVERYGGRIKVVMGSYENIKITTPGDMVVAEAVLKMREGGA
jgi:2-C-methyl-D-erythritol 4-phosphate cytidylyltransferase